LKFGEAEFTGRKNVLLLCPSHMTSHNLKPLRVMSSPGKATTILKRLPPVFAMMSSSSKEKA